MEPITIKLGEVDKKYLKCVQKYNYIVKIKINISIMQL